MFEPGDVVIVDFPGAQGVKRRPGVVLSTQTYHRDRPDVILGLLTTRIPAKLAPTDYVPNDWGAAGLHQPSVFRAYLATLDRSELSQPVGRLIAGDWCEVRKRCRLAVDIAAAATDP